MKRTLTPGRIPVLNMCAHPVRTLVLMMLSLAQAACLFSILMLMLSMHQEMGKAEARLGADILVYPSAAMSRISSKRLLMQGTPVEVWKDRSSLSRMEECDGIAAASFQLYIRDTTGDIPVWIVGYEPEKDFVIAPWVQDGSSGTLPDGSVLAGSKAAVRDGTVLLFGQAWPVYGRLAETGSEMDEMVYVNPETLGRLIEAAGKAGETKVQAVDPQNDYTVALLRIEDKDDLDSITSWLNTYVRKVQAVRSEETLSGAAAGIGGQIRLTTVIAAIIWIVILLALGITQSMMMKERRNELYVWKAIGASRSIVSHVLLRETALIYGMGAVLGTAAGTAIQMLLIRAELSLPVFLLSALVSLCLSVLIGCAGTMSAVRQIDGLQSGQMLLTE